MYTLRTPQSASGVNAFLSRLLPNLKNRCITNGVKPIANNTAVFGDEAAKVKNSALAFLHKRTGPALTNQGKLN